MKNITYTERNGIRYSNKYFAKTAGKLLERRF